MHNVDHRNKNDEFCSLQTVFVLEFEPGQDFIKIDEVQTLTFVFAVKSQALLSIPVRSLSKVEVAVVKFHLRELKTVSVSLSIKTIKTHFS